MIVTMDGNSTFRFDSLSVLTDKPGRIQHALVLNVYESYPATLLQLHDAVPVDVVARVLQLLS